MRSPVRLSPSSSPPKLRHAVTLIGDSDARTGPPVAKREIPVSKRRRDMTHLKPFQSSSQGGNFPLQLHLG